MVSCRVPESQDTVSPTLPPPRPKGGVPKGRRWCVRDSGGWLRAYAGDDDILNTLCARDMRSGAAVLVGGLAVQQGVFIGTV